MKHYLRLSALALCLSWGVIGNGQPVFTYSDFAPQSNDQYTVNNAQYITPGSSGANQTWNFSGAIISTTTTFSVNSISSIPCGSQYPAATLGIGTGAYQMMQITTTEYNCFGNSLTPGMADFIYGDPEKRFAFPMNYADNFSDVFSGASNATQTIYKSGNNTITYDGYGTIITPTATYNNAIRMHRQITWTDSSQTGTDVCSGDYYYWFATGYRYPVAQIWSVNCTGGPSIGSMFLQSITIGVDEPDTTSPLVSAFPNPFYSTLHLSCPESYLNDCATIIDASGRMLKTFVISSSTMVIELGDLEDGLYALNLGDKKAIYLIKSSTP